MQKRQKPKGRDLRQQVGGQADLNKLPRCFVFNQLWVILFHISFFPLFTLRERSLADQWVFSPWVTQINNTQLLITRFPWWRVGHGKSSFPPPLNYCLVIAVHFICAKLFIKAPWCRCMIFTCISLSELGHALQMNNPISHWLKTAKLVYCLWSKGILYYQCELLTIDT